MKVDYAGTTRYSLPGALTYPGGPPELGTILGPNGYGEYVTVVAHNDGRALVAVANRDDFAALNAPGREARSAAEIALMKLRRPQS